MSEQGPPPLAPANHGLSRWRRARDAARLNRDWGLQPERTAMAWQRTGLSATLGCCVIALTALKREAPAFAVVAVVVGLLLAAMATFRFPDGRVPASGRLHSWPLLLRATASTITLGILGLVLCAISLVP